MWIKCKHIQASDCFEKVVPEERGNAVRWEEQGEWQEQSEQVKKASAQDSMKRNRPRLLISNSMTSDSLDWDDHKMFYVTAFLAEEHFRGESEDEKQGI